MTKSPATPRRGARLRGFAHFALLFGFVLSCHASAAKLPDDDRNVPDYVQQYNRGVQLMKKRNFKDALANFERMIREHDGARIGPAFGMVHYHAGLCLMQLREFAHASEQFRICYEKYPNAMKKGDSQKRLRQR